MSASKGENTEAQCQDGLQTGECKPDVGPKNIGVTQSFRKLRNSKQL